MHGSNGVSFCRLLALSVLPVLIKAVTVVSVSKMIIKLRFLQSTKAKPVIGVVFSATRKLYPQIRRFSPLFSSPPLPNPRPRQNDSDSLKTFVTACRRSLPHSSTKEEEEEEEEKKLPTAFAYPYRAGCSPSDLSLAETVFEDCVCGLPLNETRYWERLQIFLKGFFIVCLLISSRLVLRR